jgi:hypothetical protein
MSLSTLAHLPTHCNSRILASCSLWNKFTFLIRVCIHAIISIIKYYIKNLRKNLKNKKLWFIIVIKYRNNDMKTRVWLPTVNLRLTFVFQRNILPESALKFGYLAFCESLLAITKVSQFLWEIKRSETQFPVQECSLELSLLK